MRTTMATTTMASMNTIAEKTTSGTISAERGNTPRRRGPRRPEADSGWHRHSVAAINSAAAITRRAPPGGNDDRAVYLSNAQWPQGIHHARRACDALPYSPRRHHHRRAIQAAVSDDQSEQQNTGDRGFRWPGWTVDHHLRIRADSDLPRREDRTPLAVLGRGSARGASVGDVPDGRSGHDVRPVQLLRPGG